MIYKPYRSIVRVTQKAKHGWNSHFKENFIVSEYIGHIAKWFCVLHRHVSKIGN